MYPPVGSYQVTISVCGTSGVRSARGYGFMKLAILSISGSLSGVRAIEPVSHLLMWLILTTKTNLMRLVLVVKINHINKCDTGSIARTPDKLPEIDKIANFMNP